MQPVNIGRYVIKAELGQGGMATVYLAFDPYVKREVAIKLLPATLTHDPAFRARFEREAQTVATLEFPAIVPVYDFGEENGQPYLVMQYMPGGSLAQKVKNGPLPLADVSRIYTRLGPALDHVHSLGIIHRDLKPANILFDLYNNAYLSDFGIAYITAGNASLTGSGMVGTPAYMSPEQARGDAVLDGRSDIYSMGVILFEALTAKQPFEATTPMGVAVKHLTEDIPLLRDYQPELPDQCQVVLDQAMAKEVDQRFQSASSMAQALMLVAVKTIKNLPQPEEQPTARIASPAMALRTAGNLPVKAAHVAEPPAAALQPGNTPLPALHTPGSGSALNRTAIPPWVWIVLGVSILGAICLIIMIIVLLAIF